MAISPLTIDRLKSQLITSQLNRKDPPLFQVINQLIDILRDAIFEVNTIIGGGGSGGGSITTLVNNNVLLPFDSGSDSNNNDELSILLGISGKGRFLKGSVIFSDGSNFAEDNPNFFWNDLTNSLELRGADGGIPIEIHSIFSQGIEIYTHSNTAFRAPVIDFFRSRGTESIPLAVNDEDTIGYFEFFGYNSGDAAFNDGFKIVVKALGDWSIAGNKDAAASFSISGIEKALITTNGLGVNGGIPDSSYALKVNGSISAESLQLTSGNSMSVSSPGIDGIDGDFELPIPLGQQGKSFKKGSVIFSNGMNFEEDNPNFFYEDVNNDLLLGATSHPIPVLAGRGWVVSRELNAEGSFFSHGGVSGTFRFVSSGGTKAVPTASTIGSIGSLALSGHDGINYVAAGKALIELKAEETWSTTAQGTLIRFSTTPIGSVTRNVRLSIGNEGNIKIGSLVPASNGTLVLEFEDGTAPSGLASNSAGEFADDVGGTVEMFGINEAGNTSQLTGLNIRKTADESVTNSTTFQADDHLTVNLAASSSYQFEIRGFWTTAGATAGIQVQLDGTVGIGALKAAIVIYDNTLNTIAALARVTAFNSPVGAGLTGDNGFTIIGCIETTTAGTLFLEWTQNAADVVNATTVQENSYFILRKLNG